MATTSLAFGFLLSLLQPGSGAASTFLFNANGSRSNSPVFFGGVFSLSADALLLPLLGELLLLLLLLLSGELLPGLELTAPSPLLRHDLELIVPLPLPRYDLELIVPLPLPRYDLELNARFPHARPDLELIALPPLGRLGSELIALVSPTQSDS